MNKKSLLLFGTSLLGLLGLRLFLNSKEEPGKYTRPWMEKLTDSELKAGREEVRQRSINAGADINLYKWCENTLKLFDDVIRERKNATTPSKPHAYSIPREHGWNLYKPD